MATLTDSSVLFPHPLSPHFPPRRTPSPASRPKSTEADISTIKLSGVAALPYEQDPHRVIPSHDNAAPLHESAAPDSLDLKDLDAQLIFPASPLDFYESRYTERHTM